MHDTNRKGFGDSYQERNNPTLCSATDRSTGLPMSLSGLKAESRGLINRPRTEIMGEEDEASLASPSPPSIVVGNE